MGHCGIAVQQRLLLKGKIGMLMIAA